MVRAVVFEHLEKCLHCGYQKISQQPKRYRTIDTSSLMEIVELHDIETLQQQHQHWLKNELLTLHTKSDINWSKSVVEGSETFVNEVHALPGRRAKKEKK